MENWDAVIILRLLVCNQWLHGFTCKFIWTCPTGHSQDWKIRGRLGFPGTSKYHSGQPDPSEPLLNKMNHPVGLRSGVVFQRIVDWLPGPQVLRLEMRHDSWWLTFSIFCHYEWDKSGFISFNPHLYSTRDCMCTCSCPIRWTVCINLFLSRM